MTAGFSTGCTSRRAREEVLTIFFPMWNEEATIHRAVAAAFEVADELVEEGEIVDYEVLIVDDASTDATGKLADELAARNPRVRVVHHPENRKLGGALKTGFAEARGDVVLYTDADLPFDLLDARQGPAAPADLRGRHRERVPAGPHQRGPRRTVYSFIYNHLVRWTLGLRIRDVNFAFKLVRREVLDRVHLESEGSFIDVELLAKAQRMGFRTIQFGVDYFARTRGVSTLSSGTVILKILREMRRLVPEIRRTQP